MLPEDRIRITHMRDACESVSRFIVGKTTADLADDQMLQFALVRAIEIIGEAAGRVSEDVQKSAPEIPWREAVGIRNRLVHAYFDVDLGILWQTAVESVPQMQERLEKLLIK
jgi:uncharacterized protein with HEPN domain